MLWSMEARVEASTDWHAHAVHEFIFCLAGSGCLATQMGETALAPHRSLLIPPGVVHRFVFARGETATLQVVCLDGAETAAFLSPTQNALLLELGRRVPSVADHGEAGSRVQGLMATLMGGNEPDPQVRWSMLGLLLALHGKAGQTVAEGLDTKYHQRIAEVKGWLDGNLEQSISLEALANHFGMSRSLLTREFRRHVGLSVIDYCNQRRLERAAQLLAGGRGSVTDAAFASGFANISHFHRQFKAVFGMTPAGFRRQVTGSRVDVV